MLEPFDWNCTVPVGKNVPLPDGVIVAVSVTLWPCVIVLFEEATVVLVIPGVTVSATIPDVAT